MRLSPLLLRQALSGMPIFVVLLLQRLRMFLASRENYMLLHRVKVSKKYGVAVPPGLLEIRRRKIQQNLSTFRVRHYGDLIAYQVRRK